MAASIKPDAPAPHYNKGFALAKLGRLKDAVTSFRRCSLTKSRRCADYLLTLKFCAMGGSSGRDPLKQAGWAWFPERRGSGN